MRAIQWLIVAMVSLAGHASGATPAPAVNADPPPAPTAQQQFDAATAAAVQGHCTEALQTFEALAARPGIARNAKVMAAIRARSAGCLVTTGRFDEASNDAVNAMPLLNADDPVDRANLALAHLALGQVA